jgi:hypothetical protein
MDPDERSARQAGGGDLRSCPVREECLRWALRDPSLVGFGVGLPPSSDAASKGGGTERRWLRLLLES